MASAARALRRRPVYPTLSILLLALGVGAVAAIFAVVDATLLRSLPYPKAAELYWLAATQPVTRDSSAPIALSWGQLSRWRGGTRAFSAIEGFTPATMKLLGFTEPEPLQGAVVSAGFFDLLGWKPALGTLFTRNDERPQSGVAVISYGLWQRRFGGDPRVVGRVVNIDDEPRTIVAVMPEGFSMLFRQCDVWTPMILTPEQQLLKVRIVATLGRLRPGTTIEQAKAELVGINKELAAVQPEMYRYDGVQIKGLQEWIFGSRRASLLVLLAAVALLLAVAIVNVSSLTHADALARRTATMTRLAFGAGRRDIVMIRLLETALIGAGALVVGLAVGRLGLGALRTVSPDAVPGFAAIGMDWRVVVVTLGVVALATLACGLPVAFAESRVGLAGLAGAAARAVGGAQDRRRRGLLLGAQVATAMVLLVGAMLLARNVQDLLGRPTGYRSEGVTVVELTFSRTYATKEARAAYAERLIDALRAVPGVEAVATIQTRFVPNEFMQTPFEIEGRPVETGVQQMANIRHTTPDILKVLRLRLLRGRGFESTDRLDSPPVAVVSASFARRYWGSESPLGKRIRRGINNPSSPWMEVVGVVDDIDDSGVEVDNAIAIWVSYLQQNTPTARPTIVLRSRVGPSALYPALRHAIWSVDSRQTIDAIDRLDTLLLKWTAQQRFAALVALLFATSALALVLSGIYAVTLYGVIRRTRELGVRAALGARPADLVRTAMWESVRAVLAGAAAGAIAAIPAALAMQRALANGVTIADAPRIGLVLAALVGTACVAAFLPARRALAIPPAVAMRE